MDSFISRDLLGPAGVTLGIPCAVAEGGPTLGGAGILGGIVFVSCPKTSVVLGGALKTVRQEGRY